MTQRPILSIQNLNFNYGTRSILENVSLSMDAQDFVAIIGPNGGGKSTLLKCIMGIFKPQSGTIEVFGTTAKKGRQFMGYLPQFRNVDGDYPITVLETVMMSTLNGNPFKHFSKQDQERAKLALSDVKISNLASRSLSALSGGEKQRVFLARALMSDPKLLILDEPTTSIDAPSEQEFYGLLGELNQKMAILMVSHDISMVSTTVKNIACLNKKLIYHGTKELTSHDLEETYGCDVELIAHGMPHRVLKDHD